MFIYSVTHKPVTLGYKLIVKLVTPVVLVIRTRVRHPYWVFYPTTISDPKSREETSNYLDLALGGNPV